MIRVRTLAFVIAMLLAVALTIAVTEAVAPSGGPSVGIGVHGHWTIDVHDADGSVAASHEFDNALTGSGDDALAGLLAGEWELERDSAGTPAWYIAVDGVSGGLCADGGGNPLVCFIGLAEIVTSTESGDLTVERIDGTLRLRGSFEADFAGSIGEVNTRFPLPLDHPLPTDAFTFKLFDDTDADTTNDTIPVTEGQFVTVTVDITFSDAPA